MAVTAFLYGKFFNQLSVKDVDVDTDDLRVMLCTSTYTPNQDTHEFKSDVTNEVVGAGYTAGGQTLTSPVASYTAGTNTWAFDADDASWLASTITARYAVVYDWSSGGADASRRLIGYIDFGGDFTSTAAEFRITWDAAGIFKVVVA